MSADEFIVPCPTAEAFKNAPLNGETNATTSFLNSAIEIILFAIACASCCG